MPILPGLLRASKIGRCKTQRLQRQGQSKQFPSLYEFLQGGQRRAVSEQNFLKLFGQSPRLFKLPGYPDTAFLLNIVFDGKAEQGAAFTIPFCTPSASRISMHRRLPSAMYLRCTDTGNASTAKPRRVDGRMNGHAGSRCFLRRVCLLTSHFLRDEVIQIISQTILQQSVGIVIAFRSVRWPSQKTQYLINWSSVRVKAPERQFATSLLNGADEQSMDFIAGKLRGNRRRNRRRSG